MKNGTAGDCWLEFPGGTQKFFKLGQTEHEMESLKFKPHVFFLATA
jgi:uncharacterized membrane protein YphA (DoxX/SURF4 family)